MAGRSPSPRCRCPARSSPLSTVTPVARRCPRRPVLAKVVRDRLMREESIHYPAYHFERNKGYPSPLHKIALRGYGLSAIHRRSWSFVGDLPWR